ncbi:MAG: hypothetical protein LJE62_01375, partial [Silicimonas sp.]|nr:hypothetical protein [Silicimonas sp.]
MSEVDVELFSKTVESEFDLQDICNGEETNDPEKLEEKRGASVPVVSAMVDELSALGIPSEYNLKKTNAAQSKVSRPATRQKYPWF